MKKISYAFVLYFLVLPLLHSTSVEAGVRLSAVGGLGVGSLIGFRDGADTNFNPEVGAEIELKLFFIGLEAGLFWDKRNASYTSTSNNAAYGTLRETYYYSGSALVLPVLARIWPVDNFSIGAGPYGARYIGDIGYTAGVLGPKNGLPKTTYLRTEGSEGYDAANRKTYDAGGVVSLMWGTKSGSGSFTFVDLRYSRSFFDQTLAPGDAFSKSYFSVFQILIGFGPSF